MRIRRGQASAVQQRAATDVRERLQGRRGFCEQLAGELSEDTAISAARGGDLGFLRHVAQMLPSRSSRRRSTPRSTSLAPLTETPVRLPRDSRSRTARRGRCHAPRAEVEEDDPSYCSRFRLGRRERTRGRGVTPATGPSATAIGRTRFAQDRGNLTGRHGGVGVLQPQHTDVPVMGRLARVQSAAVDGAGAG